MKENQHISKKENGILHKLLNRKYVVILISLFLLILTHTSALSQTYLHIQGKYLYDGNNNEIILRGIGTGNWMIQEGYMMRTSDIAPTMHEFKAKLIASVGAEKTDSFYSAWLAYHFTRTDVDSMKSWGFNSVRVAMHYKWFTLPIEEEPVSGQNTWLEKGFIMIDSLLDWCSDNEMYLILDMHGTPGGQGNDAAISDYDDTKDHLWENQLNKDKLVALWHRLAERYNDEPWIGGYDLINETNYTFPEGNNSQLRALFGAITTSIREVDTNHIIIIEGNSYANDFSGLTPKWDNKMIYSFHNYWNSNSANKLDWIISMRNAQNVPVWLGESGENSNSWYAGMISLCEKNHIGWSWWPVKKAGINNPLRVSVNTDYTALINYWKGQGTAPSQDAAFQTVLAFAANHKIENCYYQKDVVDAMIRQPGTNETKPFKTYRVGEAVFATDFDLGRVGHAYYDTDTANNSGSAGGTNSVWNQGNNYRNDGVDIEACTDATETNGYNVGWTNDKEWMQYTVESDTAAAYTLNIRYASGSGGAIIHMEVDGAPVTGKLTLPGTGGWQTWTTYQVSDVIFPAGIHKVKFVFDQGGANLNFFKFTNPVLVSSVDFKVVYAQTSVDGNLIKLYLNKKITSTSADIQPSDFSVEVDNVNQPVSGYNINVSDSSILMISLTEPISYGLSITVSYSGNAVFSDAQALINFNELEVVNMLPQRHNVPARIQAESYYVNHGFEFEACTDAGAGSNTSYAAPGDYLDYLIHVTAAGEYQVNYRFATERSNASIIIRTDQSGSFVSIDTVNFTNTGGWQSWQTQSSNLFLEAGNYVFRILVRQSEHNLNWFEIVIPSGIGEILNAPELKIFPNPVNESATVEMNPAFHGTFKIQLYSTTGSLLFESEPVQSQITLPTAGLAEGVYYLLALVDGYSPVHSKLLVSRGN